MLKIIVLLSSTLIHLCLSGESCPKEICDCGIAGEWKNQLGSNMTLKCKDGQLEGEYNSPVGQAAHNYILSGRYTMAGPKKDVVVLGWVVSWNNKLYGNSQSATTWSGIYYPKDEIIRTQWILTSYKERDDYWATSLINHDEFVRIK